MHKIKSEGEPRVCPRLYLNWECSQKCINSMPEPVSHSSRALVSLKDMLAG